MDVKSVPGRADAVPRRFPRPGSIPVLLLFIALLAAVGVSWYVLFVHSAEDTSSAAVRDNSQIYLREIASQKENQLQMNLRNQTHRLSITVEMFSEEHFADELSMRDFLSRMKEVNDFGFLGLLDSEGIVHTEAQDFPGISKFNFLARDLTEEIVEFNNTVSSSNLVMFVVPIEGYTYDGVEMTALVGGVDTKTVADRMALFDSDTNAFCEVVMRNGAYVMQAPRDHLGSGSNYLSAMEWRAVYDEGYSHSRLVSALNAGEAAFASYTVDGRRYFTYMMPVDGTEWYLKASIPYDAVGDGVEVVRATLTRNSIAHMAILLLVFSGAFLLYLVMRRRQDAVIMAQIQAEENNRAKTDFLSQMSHDIRTPMNAIVGFTDFAIREDDISVIKENYLPKIKSSGEHLLMLINDVLEMSRIESGRIEFNDEPIHLGQLLQETASIISVRAQSEGLTLETHFDMNEPWVYCDKLRLNRVLMNLLGNAVKFTPGGGNITLSVSQTSADASGFAEYELCVADTGIGMSPDFVKRVFEPFERERSSTVSRKEGTGLGLSIVKRIVDAKGGTIAVESVKGKGSVFKVRLRLRLVEPELQRKLEAEQKKLPDSVVGRDNIRSFSAGKRVLLVEDNELNRFIAIAVLEEAGFAVDCAEDGTVAVEKLREASPGFYSVILMDIQMPIMDGYEASRLIRGMSGGRESIPILALTANAFASDVKAAKDAGMDGHIAKPIDIAALYSALAEKI